jgi:hypothetical protein
MQGVTKSRIALILKWLINVTWILSTPSQEFARHCLANLPVVNMQELRKGFNIIRYSSTSRLYPDPIPALTLMARLGRIRRAQGTRSAAYVRMQKRLKPPS